MAIAFAGSGDKSSDASGDNPPGAPITCGSITTMHMDDDSIYEQGMWFVFRPLSLMS
jgi:hypothetical protein